MRRAGSLIFLFSVLTSCAKSAQPVDTAVRLSEGNTVDVPFSVRASGTYDIQLQYPKDGIYIHLHIFDQIAGAATLRAGAKTLSWQLPTGWCRLSPYDSNALGTVLVRFHAYAYMPYVLTLHIDHLPNPLEDRPGVVSVYKVGPLFHPGHHVYEVQ